MYVDTIANPGSDGVQRKEQSLGLCMSFNMLIGHVRGFWRVVMRHNTGRQH
jgi:hypothetical protein